MSLDKSGSRSREGSAESECGSVLRKGEVDSDQEMKEHSSNQSEYSYKPPEWKSEQFRIHRDAMKNDDDEDDSLKHNDTDIQSDIFSESTEDSKEYSETDSVEESNGLNNHIDLSNHDDALFDPEAVSAEESHITESDDDECLIAEQLRIEMKVHKLKERETEESEQTVNIQFWFALLSIFLGMAALTTDVWITISLFIQGRMMWFWISISIFIISTVLSCCLTFSVEFFNEADNTVCDEIWTLIIIFLCGQVTFQFIPQLILHTILMALFDELHISELYICDLVFGILVVLVSGLVVKQLTEGTYYWYLSVVTDLVLMLTIISWLVTGLNQIEDSDISIQKWMIELMIYKVWFFTAGVIVFLVVCFFISMIFILLIQIYNQEWDEVRNGSLFITISTPISIIGTVLSIIISEVLCFTCLPLFYDIMLDRMPFNGPKEKFFKYIKQFIDQSENWSDLKMRVILINEVLNNLSRGKINPNQDDPRLDSFLQFSRKDRYRKVKWSDLRNISDHNEYSTPLKVVIASHSEFWKDIKTDYELPDSWQHWTECVEHSGYLVCIFDCVFNVLLRCVLVLVEFVVVPLHIISRLFNVSFVWIALFTFDWTVKDNRLALGLSSLFIVFQIAWFVSFIRMVYVYFAIWHITPGLREIKIDVSTYDDARRKFVYLMDVYDTLEAGRKITRQGLRNLFSEEGIISVIQSYMCSDISEINTKPYLFE